MRRIAKVAAVGVAGLGLLSGVTPAHAAPRFAAFAFHGNATFAPGLGYPTPGATGSNGTWSLTTVAGAGAVVPGPTIGTVSVNIAGSFQPGAVQTVASTALAYLGSGAFCGALGGSGGNGQIDVSAILGESANIGVSNVRWVQSAGGLIVYQGDTNAGLSQLSGSAFVHPNPTAGSCTNGTAVSFIVVGTGTAFFNG